jgi:hypothetical protein
MRAASNAVSWKAPAVGQASVGSAHCPAIKLTANLGKNSPIVQAVQRYINPTYQMVHTTEPFDSTGGDLIVLYASSHQNVIFTPSDNFDNRWISIAGPANTTGGFDLRSQMWYAEAGKVGPGQRISLHLSKKQPLVISVFVVSGADKISPIQAVSLVGDDDGTKSVNAESPPISVANKNDLLLGWVKASAGARFKAEQGFSQQDGASSDFLASESRTALSPGTYNTRFTLNKPQTWQSAVVAIAGSDQATLTWTVTAEKKAKREHRFIVEKCGGASCSDFAPIALSTATRYIDSSLKPSQDYRYRVEEYNGGHLATLSSIVSLTTPVVRPSLPGNVTAIRVLPTETNLSWTPATEGLKAASEYMVERCRGAQCSDFKEVAITSVTSYEDRSVPSGVRCRYQVRAIDAAGNAGPALVATNAPVLVSPGPMYVIGFAFISIAPCYRFLRAVVG